MLRALALAVAVALATVVATALPAAAATREGPTTPEGLTTDRLGAGEGLRVGQALVSANGAQRLVLQPDGVLALFGPAEDPRWVSDAGVPGDALRVRRDGDVALVAPDGAVVWRTGTSGHRGATLVLQDDGDLVVRGRSGETIWDARTTVAPATLEAGRAVPAGGSLASPDGRHVLVVGADGGVRLLGPAGDVRWSTLAGPPGSRLVLTSGGDLVVAGPTGQVGWHTGTAPHRGAVLTVQDDGALVLRSATGVVLWTSGTALGPAELDAGQAVPSEPGLASLDGRLQLRAAADVLALTYDGQPVWSARVALPTSGAFVVRDDDGLALVAPDGSTSWSTSTPGGPGAALGLEPGAAVLRSAAGVALWHRDVPARLLVTPAVVAPDCGAVTGPVDIAATVPTSAGVRVHRCLAAAVDALVAAAAKDGVALSAGSGWRSAQEQAALRKAHCGPARDDPRLTVCSPPTAAVGSSRHERGLALDFTQDGRSLSRDSTGFAWLVAHAADYGLHNLPSEPWHWSTDGA